MDLIEEVSVERWQDEKLWERVKKEKGREREKREDKKEGWGKIWINRNISLSIRRKTRWMSCLTADVLKFSCTICFVGA